MFIILTEYPQKEAWKRILNVYSILIPMCDVEVLVCDDIYGMS